MHYTNIPPELHYRRTSQGITLTACYGLDGCIYLPDEIEGEAITAIAPYTFSSRLNGVFGADVNTSDCDFIWTSPDAHLASGRRRLGAEDIIEVHLPRYIREIGNYAFYRCRNMRKLTLHDTLPSIGGGALTGCRFQEVEIYLHNGGQSALKSILEEIWFAVHVRFHHLDSEGVEEISEILFPEHYEEAVENTPARILYTSHHGAGGYYRQCFYNRELDYKKYDELLPWAIAEEEEDTVVRLSLLRLVYPYKLSELAKKDYMAYVRGHIEAAVKILIEEEDTEKLAFLSAGDYWTEDVLDYGIEYAGRIKKTGVLSMLMDEKHKRFPKKRKSFEL